MPDQPLLAVRGLTKRFPGVLALDHVSLDVYPGESVAVIGENGAGKSTLMKILAGIHTADAGAIHLDGAPVEIDSVRRATSLGIALIHQELNLAGNLSVGANIFLGREPHVFGFVNARAVNDNALTYLNRLGLLVDPEELVDRLSIGRQQLVEIAKALSANARLLIMDEPTSSLSQHETEQLYNVIAGLRREGVSIVYISHRLGEVKEVADRVVVLRDGKNAGELQKNEINHDAMVRLMVGRDLVREKLRETASAGDVVLEVAELTTIAHPRERVNFSLRAGEIVGIAGLVGAGRTEVLETIFGIRPVLEGTVRVNGKPVTIRHPKDAIRAGVALVPEDRKAQGVILEMTLRENMSLARLHRDANAGFLGRQAERNLAAEMMSRLDVRATSAEQIARLLSGGNQQKIVLGKWLALRPRILLLDEPTRGVDVGAKGEIYALMDRLAQDGVAILFVSSEMEEILTVSDRVLVLHEGRITGELSGDALTEEAVMQLATGAGIAAAS